jgi:signal transduction histidine kinase
MQGVPPIIYECHAAALKRALRNLLDNAVKYGKSGTVRIRRAPKAVEIVIDDEGPGIPEPELARVLEPFYRLDESRSRETGGVGLGLAIAQSIVHTHGGTLSLSNRPEGGLRVRLSLPV